MNGKKGLLSKFTGATTAAHVLLSYEAEGFKGRGKTRSMS